MKNKTNFLRLPALSMGVFLFFAISCDSKKDSFTDPRDGNVYKTVTIGDQVWMAENLAYAPSSSNYWAYDNNNGRIATYGYLYDWQTALNVCPTGWHLPSDNDWTQLTDYLGGEEIAGGKLKATGNIEEGTGLWHDPNTGATNEIDFTALPGGDRDTKLRKHTGGSFIGIGYNGSWWSSTELNTSNAWLRNMYYKGSDVDRYSDYKELGFSVRCLRG